MVQSSVILCYSNVHSEITISVKIKNLPGTSVSTETRAAKWKVMVPRFRGCAWAKHCKTTPQKKVTERERMASCSFWRHSHSLGATAGIGHKLNVEVQRRQKNAKKTAQELQFNNESIPPYPTQVSHLVRPQGGVSPQKQLGQVHKPDMNWCLSKHRVRAT